MFRERAHKFRPSRAKGGLHVLHYTMEKHEELSAEDAAWEKMSYTDRFMWYLDHKILKTAQKIPSKEVKEHVKEHVEVEPVANVEAAVEAVAGAEANVEAAVEAAVEAEANTVSGAEATVEPATEVEKPTKKRTKGKKISIEM